MFSGGISTTLFAITCFSQKLQYIFSVRVIGKFLPPNDILNYAKKINNVKLNLFDFKWFFRVMSMEKMSIEVEVDLYMFQEELVVILFIKLGFRFIIYKYKVVGVCLLVLMCDYNSGTLGPIYTKLNSVLS